MTNEQFATQQKMTVSKLRDVIDSFRDGVTVNAIIVKFKIGYLKVNRIIDFHVWQSKDLRPMVDMTKQYYQKENEMIIQDYKAEDLTGDEKLIFEKL
jgi:hypothetical protein